MEDQRPKPPEDMGGEALLEWHRACAELEKLDRLDAVDRAILTLHCETWATYQTANRHVMKFGPVIKWPNGVPGPSPFYKCAKECAGILRGTLADLGLTPAARGFNAAKADDAGALDF